jgi:hypothetical protein
MCLAQRILKWDFHRIVTGSGALVEEDGREVQRHGGCVGI